jgi:hypothetical protein
VDSLEPLGRSLIVLGVALAALGAVLVLGPRVPILGHLPGDLVIHRDNVTIYIPITTMILVSVIASVVLGLLSRR